MKKQIWSGLLGAALALCLCVVVLAASLYVCGTCAPLMTWMMRTHAPSSVTGLPDVHYEPLVRMFTGYLSGQVSEFQYTLEAQDFQMQVFHGYEQLHMADCRSLFELCRRIMLGSAVLCVALFGFTRAGKPAMKGMCIATGAALLLVAALGIAAAIDFESLFILFHQLSFSNSMWMLTPQTDMLIRLMPIDLFVHYVCIIGAVWGGFMLLMLGVSAKLGFGK